MSLEKIQDYVNNNFPENHRDTVVETILKANALGRVLESVEGMAITDDIFSTISGNVGRIVQIAMEGKFSEKMEEVRTAADEIAFLTRHIYKWAGVIKAGAEHLERAENG